MLLAQLLDPFRIGLVIMLLSTTIRTQGSAGTLAPLALGIVFVAVLIPATLGSAEEDKAMPIAVGLLSNAILLAIALAARAALRKLTEPGS